ncbi:hypothetical protein FRB94_012293 [Tulasnella sp. JGI-2019a]|nr:hypothetical protein FRB94_012293 [Tulasnella sp. JGI-2019a]
MYIEAASVLTQDAVYIAGGGGRPLNGSKMCVADPTREKEHERAQVNTDRPDQMDQTNVEVLIQAQEDNSTHPQHFFSWVPIPNETRARSSGPYASVSQFPSVKRISFLFSSRIIVLPYS